MIMYMGRNVYKKELYKVVTMVNFKGHCIHCLTAQYQLCCSMEPLEMVAL